MSKNGPGSRAEIRRLSAEKRIAAASKRTPEEQLKRLDAAGFVAKKERAKLAARIAARQKKAAKDLMKATTPELGAAAVAGAKKTQKPVKQA